jgi:hypothetical protein
MNTRIIKKHQVQTLAELELKENEDENIEHLCITHFKKFGQLKIPIICVVDGKVRVIDGMKYMRTISNHADEVMVNYIGELDLFDFYVLRIYMNFTNQRTHFINIAKLVSEIVGNAIDKQKIANRTNLTPVEVDRYNELLNFDWDEFRRTEIDESQIKLL